MSLQTPLHTRLPNPPPVFVGRDRERERLRRCVTRGATTFVSGPQGIGKTALVLATLSEADVRERSVYVPLAAPTDAVREVARSTLEARGQTDALPTDSEELLVAALAAADDGALVVVVDDVTEVARSGIERVALAFGRYARSARLVCIGRVVPPGDFIEQRVEVGPLARTALRELAVELLDQDGPRVDEVVDRAEGNPGSLRTLCARAADRAATRRGDSVPPLPVASAPELAELVRLLSSRDLDGARALLDRDREALVSAGLGAELFRFLNASPARALDGHRLAVGVSLGDDGATASLRLPDVPTSADLSRWSDLLALRNDLAGAVHAAERALDLAADDDERFEATLARAEMLGRLGRAEEMLATLDPHLRGEGEQRTRAGAVAVHALAQLRRPREAVELATIVHAGLDALRGQALVTATHHLARGLFDAGRPQLALDAIEVASRFLAPAAVARDRRFLALRVNVAIATGRLSLAADLVTDLGRIAGDAALHRALVRLVDATRRFYAGELDGLADEVVALAAHTRRIGDRPWEGGLAELRARVSALHGVRWDAREGPPLSELAPRLRTRLALVYAIVALRSGDAISGVEAEALDGDDAWADQLTVLRGLARATRATVEGEHEAAAVAVREASRVAVELGYVLLEAELAHLACDVACASGNERELGAAAAHLAELGETLASKRFAEEAGFYQVVARRPHAPSALERIAALEAVAPVAARRARALLGGEPSLDALDRLVLAAVRERFGWASTRTLLAPGAEWRPGWGLDLPRHAVWLGGGREVDLSGHATLFKLLVALSSGSSDKEALVASVWGDRTYDPRLHDNKIRLAVRKLRALVEDDPRAPTRLLTSEQGYRLEGPVRVHGE